jgi:hypothetical protein
MSLQNQSELRLAFYNKAVKIGSLSKMISDYLNTDLSTLKLDGREDINIYFLGDIIRQSSFLAPYIKKISQEVFSEQRYHYANNIKLLTKKLLINCKRLENCNSDGSEFLSILKTELRRFNIIQKKWLLTI